METLISSDVLRKAGMNLVAVFSHKEGLDLSLLTRELIDMKDDDYNTRIAKYCVNPVKLTVHSHCASDPSL